jgi:hypothetical protein
MTSRKAVVGVSFLCALAFCAFGAASASAAATTAGECTNVGGTHDFTDPHCDNAVVPGTGPFGHVLFPAGLVVNTTTANDFTGIPSVFKLEAKIGGVSVAVTCNKVSGTGTVTNNAGPPMSVAFGDATIKFTECFVEKPEVCAGAVVTFSEAVVGVAGPHNLRISVAKKLGPTFEEITFHEQNAAGTEMGLKYQPTVVNNPIMTITFPAACGFGVNPIAVKGFFYSTGGRGGAATSSGATEVFTKSSTIGGLTVAGSPATLEGTLTLRKTNGNPLIITTIPGN